MPYGILSVKFRSTSQDHLPPNPPGIGHFNKSNTHDNASQQRRIEDMAVLKKEANLQPVNGTNVHTILGPESILKESLALKELFVRR